MYDPLEETIIGIFRENTEAGDVVPTNVPSSGQLTGEIRAFLFDIYGVLFSSASGDIGTPGEMPRQELRINRLLRRYGIKKNAAAVEKDFFHEVKKEHRRLRGRGIDFPEVRYEEIWSAVLDLEAMEVLKTFAAYYETIINPVYPMPGLNDVLSGLKEKKRVLGVISNAQFFTPLLFPALLGRDIESLGFDNQLVFYSYVHGIAKPSNHMFLEAKEVLKGKGIEPGQVVYVGNDILNDILPAQQAGFRTVLFAGDGRSLRMRETNKRCKGVAPDRIITDLKQILV